MFKYYFRIFASVWGNRFTHFFSSTPSGYCMCARAQTSPTPYSSSATVAIFWAAALLNGGMINTKIIKIIYQIFNSSNPNFRFWVPKHISSFSFGHPYEQQRRPAIATAISSKTNNSELFPLSTLYSGLVIRFNLNQYTSFIP